MKERENEGERMKERDENKKKRDLTHIFTLLFIVLDGQPHLLQYNLKECKTLPFVVLLVLQLQLVTTTIHKGSLQPLCSFNVCSSQSIDLVPQCLDPSFVGVLCSFCQLFFGNSSLYTSKFWYFEVCKALLGLFLVETKKKKKKKKKQQQTFSCLCQTSAVTMLCL